MMDEAWLNRAHELADISANIIRQAFRAPHNAATLKDDLSPVTQADKAAEAAMRAHIRQHFPQHGIIGEEEAAHQPDAEYQWILDPIDGTRAFACGALSFGTLIGLKHASTMLLGILNQPITHERWLGLHQQPSTLNNATIHSAQTTSLAHARLATTSPELFSRDEKARFDQLAHATAMRQYGGDCTNYGLLAAGHIDIVMEAGLNPYDILPLLPIMQGAGACLTDWHGNPIDTNAPRLNILVSANQSLQDQALARINAT